jgi:hypothetical protein
MAYISLKLYTSRLINKFSANDLDFEILQGRKLNWGNFNYTFYCLLQWRQHSIVIYFAYPESKKFKSSQPEILHSLINRKGLLYMAQILFGLLPKYRFL